jgi:hypothetical protein
MVYGLLVGLLVAAWFGFGDKRGSGGGMERWGSAERMVAYEEVWRREESELWEWLEERVGRGGVGGVGGGRPVEEKQVPLGEGREMDVAIKVTEEKLRALKGAVEKRKKVV